MEFKVLLGAIAVACELTSLVIYYRGIFHGDTKPHLYTHLVWAIVMTVGLLGMLAGGAEAGAWAFVVSVIFEVSFVVASLKWGTKDITNTDRVFLVLALFAIVPWIITKNPLWSVILVSIIDALGMFPTIRKTYNAPTSEPLSAWILSLCRNVLQLAALSTYTFTTVLYPSEIFAVEIVLVFVIIIRRPSDTISLI